MKKILIYLISSSLLFGCMRVDQDTVGPELSITPVHYQLEVSLDSYAVAQKKIEAFTATHAEQLEGRELEMIWYNSRGKAFLNKLSLPHNAGYSMKVIAGENRDSHFDIRLEFSSAELSTETCPRDAIGEYGNQLGCYSENARWQSMVNPQSAI